jgi:kynurenine formamidase
VEGELFRIGWHDHWFEIDFWRRGDPTLTSEAATYLMERGLCYLASDFTFTFEGDRTLDVVLTHPEGNRFLIENLCNLGEIDSDVVDLLVVP